MPHSRKTLEDDVRGGLGHVLLLSERTGCVEAGSRAGAGVRHRSPGFPTSAPQRSATLLLPPYRPAQTSSLSSMADNPTPTAGTMCSLSMFLVVADLDDKGALGGTTKSGMTREFIRPPHS